MADSPNFDDPDKMLWMGRPLRDLSKEELIEVILYYARLFQTDYTPEAIRERAVGKVVLMRPVFPYS